MLLDEMVDLEARLRTMADPDRAIEMAAYLKDQFPVLGIATPERRAAVKATVNTRQVPDHDDLVAAVDGLYGFAEREFHYCAVDLTRRWKRVLSTKDLSWLASLVETHSWWDTVDALATHPIGDVVRRDREGARPTLDRWVASDDLWLNRTAIIHQLTYKHETNPEQLFEYCDRHAGSTEFFHRKAIGWALRQYARTDAGAVIDYVNDRRQVLSGLTIREALKHL